MCVGLWFCAIHVWVPCFYAQMFFLCRFCVFCTYTFVCVCVCVCVCLYVHFIIVCVLVCFALVDTHELAELSDGFVQ